eukprot:PhF_6_TR20548/c0_g1_i1/m.29675
MKNESFTHSVMIALSKLPRSANLSDALQMTASLLNLTPTADDILLACSNLNLHVHSRIDVNNVVMILTELNMLFSSRRQREEADDVPDMLLDYVNSTNDPSHALETLWHQYHLDSTEYEDVFCAPPSPTNGGQAGDDETTVTTATTLQNQQQNRIHNLWDQVSGMAEPVSGGGTLLNLQSNHTLGLPASPRRITSAFPTTQRTNHASGYLSSAFDNEHLSTSGSNSMQDMSPLSPLSPQLMKSRGATMTFFESKLSAVSTNVNRKMMLSALSSGNVMDSFYSTHQSKSDILRAELKEFSMKWKEDQKIRMQRIHGLHTPNLQHYTQTSAILNATIKHVSELKQATLSEHDIRQRLSKGTNSSSRRPGSAPNPLLQTPPPPSATKQQLPSYKYVKSVVAKYRRLRGTSTTASTMNAESDITAQGGACRSLRKATRRIANEVFSNNLKIFREQHNITV